MVIIITKSSTRAYMYLHTAGKESHCSFIFEVIKEALSWPRSLQHVVN